MKRVVQVIVALPGVMMGISAINWLLDPAAAAEGLGMSLLDGVGRSTQIGDMTAFFATASITTLVGAVRENATWLAGAALLLGGAAVFRVLAFLLHGADLATQFIVAELVLTAILAFGMYRFSKKGDEVL